LTHPRKTPCLRQKVRRIVVTTRPWQVREEGEKLFVWPRGINRFRFVRTAMPQNFPPYSGAKTKGYAPMCKKKKRKEIKPF